jgi:hypothetical protein
MHHLGVLIEGGLIDLAALPAEAWNSELVGALFYRLCQLVPRSAIASVLNSATVDQARPKSIKQRQGQKHTDVVVVDGNLITGQNGASSKRTAQAIIDQVHKMTKRTAPVLAALSS